MEYAVFKTGGKQYQASPGVVLDVEKLATDKDQTVELTDVLLINRDGKLTVGRPTIEGAKVMAVVEEQIKGPKLVIFKFKSKTRQGVKTGHRQQLTRLRVTEIVGG
ncbi:MAG: 50S ribosomal protein L21 [Chloroflexi bacterium]|nr:50S ribosomal protein L21 [Chloroflexota bacterium]